MSLPPTSFIVVILPHFPTPTGLPQSRQSISPLSYPPSPFRISHHLHTPLPLYSRVIPATTLRSPTLRSGPAGLFAALSLAERGHSVLLLERGKAVEDRGRDIGAAINRPPLSPGGDFLCNLEEVRRVREGGMQLADWEFEGLEGREGWHREGSWFLVRGPSNAQAGQRFYHPV